MTEDPTPTGPVRALDRWTGDERFMQSLARGLLALGAVAGVKGQPVSAQEIAAATGLSIQSARRCLYTLNAIGYVRANRNGAVPGPGLAELAGAYAASSPLVTACGPVLDALHAELGVTVSVSTFEGDEPIVVASCSTDSLLRVELPIGSVMPIHCTATGKVYLASLSDAAMEQRIAASDFRAYSSRTITDAETLRKTMRTVRRDGFAMAEEELAPGLRGIAVPITGARGQVAGAVTASLIASTTGKRDSKARIVPALKAAATTLGTYLI